MLRSGFALILLAYFALPSAPQQIPASAKPPAPSGPESAKPAVTIPAARHALEKADVEAFFDGIVPLQLERSDIAGASVLVMKDGWAILKKGYGYADLSKKKAVDPDTTMFRLASISKLFTWTAVMQLVEQGKLNLDTDINQYLDFQIASGFGKPIVIRNLMTHTAGFEEEVRDIILTDPKLETPLREFLIQNQPRRIFPPGQIPAYSNYGVGLGGYIVQRVSGVPFEQYVAEHIFQPLGMNHSSFHEPLKPELSAFVSDGYKNSTDEPAVGFEIFNPAPAGGVSSTAADMGRFAQALLNGGELEGHRILKPETLNAMWMRQFAASDSLPGICMGFYQVWRNGLHFIGHEGDLIAFHSMFFIEPKEKLLLFISYNSAGSETKTRDELLNGFADRYYPYTPAPAFQKLPTQELAAIAGTYESTRRADSTKLKLLDLMDQGHAFTDKDGVLKIDEARDLRDHVRKWKPLSKDLWQEEDGQNLLFAIRDPSGKVVRVANVFAGVQFQRVPWYERDRTVLPLLCASLLSVLLVFLASLLRLGRRILLRKRSPLLPQQGTIWLTAGPRIAAFAWVLLAIGVTILMSSLQNATVPPTHTADKYFVMINWAVALAIFLTIFAVSSGLRVWSRVDLRFISKLKFSLVAAACLFLTWFAVHWNLIGPAHRY
jgi:CubicO group peptidase (beta-lactamase class C family)